MSFPVLRKKTYLYSGSFSLKIPRGTRVLVNRGSRSLIFDGKRGIEVFREGNAFFMKVYDSTMKIEFPKGGKIPFPLSML